MPLVRMVTSVAGEGFAYRFGEEADLSPEQAQRFVAAGWGELVRGLDPDTPEAAGPPMEKAAAGRRVQRRPGGG